MANYVNLYPKRSSWAVYPQGGPYTSSNAVGYLNPKQFRGLSYKILATLGKDIYLISTESYGKVAIYVPTDKEGITLPYAMYGDSSYYGTVASRPNRGQEAGRNSSTTNSVVGKYLNLHKHMTSWAVYHVNGPYTKDQKIGSLSPSQYGGLSYPIIDVRSNDILIIKTEVYGVVAIYAPVDNDSSRTQAPLYHSINDASAKSGNRIGSSIASTGTFLNLHPHMASWSVYNVNGPYTKDKAVGQLAPQRFGGLSYRVLGNPVANIYLIQTESFGKVAIYAPQDEDSSMTARPQYKEGNFGGTTVLTPSGKKENVNYLNLHPHMTSWAVYNVNGPYTKDKAVGHLSPKQFGGLSYTILGTPTNNIYIIETESFGRVAIYAPRDNDSSISNTNQYKEGNTSTYQTDNSYIFNYTPTIGDGTIDIKPRSYWGAQPVRPSGLTGYLSPHAVRQIIVHHSDTYNSTDDITAIRGAQSWHLQQDWGDIGYHIIIGRSGVIMAGRSMEQIGAHAKMPANAYSIGVCLLGSYEKMMPPQAQIDSLIDTLVYLCKRFRLSASNIVGHRDVPNNPTTCPGSAFYYGTDSLASIRAAVGKALTAKKVTPPKLTKVQHNKEIMDYVRHFINNTLYNIKMPKVSMDFEEWGNYQIIAPGVRARNGVFASYEVGVGETLLRGIYRSTQTDFGTAYEEEIRTRIDDLLDELPVQGPYIKGSLSVSKIMDSLKLKNLTPLDTKMEFEIDYINLLLRLRYIHSFKGVQLSDKSTISFDLITEIEMTSIGPILEPKPVPIPVPVPGRKVEIGESEKEKWRDLYRRFGEVAVNSALVFVAGILFFGTAALIAWAAYKGIEATIIAVVTYLLQLA